MDIEEILTPIYGKFCWNAKKGYGSFLTFEFGNPHLDISESQRSQNGGKENIRRVAVHGDWHLWIYLCDWVITSQGETLADSASKARLIHRAMDRLDGQNLVHAEVYPDCRTSFVFELGDQLEVTPNRTEYGPESELWLLYEHSGNVFTLRANQKYSYQPGNTHKDDEIWHSLFL